MNQFHFPGQTGHYKGKVRDVYFIDNSKIAVIASDRISAFDVILPRDIPFKGQILNQIAAFMLQLTSDVCPNWLEATPAPNVSVGKLCKPYKVEIVVRGNLSGHAWRVYQDGIRTLCGVHLPNGLKENDFLETPIITPSTKAAAGHDQDISREAILKSGLATEEDYAIIEKYALALFEKGREYARSRGLILADTKYEFGKSLGEICLIDEVHTPDSSRYFYADNFDENQVRGLKQKQLSKEFVREWLIENDFMGKQGQTVPEMTDEWVHTIQKRYIELYEKLLGKTFVPEKYTDEEIQKRIIDVLNGNNAPN